MNRSPADFTFTFVVSRSSHGMRIEKFLRKQLRNYTLSKIQRMIQRGFVSVDTLTAYIGMKLHSHQEVDIQLPEPPDEGYPADAAELEILYEDPWMVVVNKPAGVVMHPVTRFQRGTIANQLQHHFDTQTRLPGLIRPGIVHRLDRLTSGVIVVAKEHFSHRHLSAQFQARSIHKSYLALVHGCVSESAFKVTFPIGRHPTGNTILRSCAADALLPKLAVTHFETVQSLESCSLLEAIPLTGRLHQIRVHLEAIGHPVVGDSFYSQIDGYPVELRDSTSEFNNHPPRHFLHAWKLELRHPLTDQSMQFVATPDEAFCRLWDV